MRSPNGLSAVTLRSTEGSGLGLAIAKSYTEACGGTFDVSVDGDQFKGAYRLSGCTV